MQKEILDVLKAAKEKIMGKVSEVAEAHLPKKFLEIDIKVCEKLQLSFQAKKPDKAADKAGKKEE